jgi:cell division septal protein FtsQ
MGVIEDVASIKQELEEVKNENKKESIRIQELNKIKKANRKLLKALLVSIFAFIFLLIYTIIIVNY